MLTVALALYLFLATPMWIIPLAPSNLSDGKQPCKCVAFRLDDIQDYYNTKQQKTIIQTFIDQKAKLTIGVIGAEIGKDLEHVKFLQANSTKRYVEYANHGFNHENFTRYTLNEQTSLMAKTNSVIYDLFGRKATTFIPPYDEFDENMPVAMNNVNLHVMSGFSWKDTIAYDVKNKFIHLPGNVEFSDFDPTTQKWVPLTEHQIKVNITDVVKLDGYAVVVMHPIDFDSDAVKVKNIIDFARQSNYTIMPISGINDYYSQFFPEPAPTQQTPIIIRENTTTISTDPQVTGSLNDVKNSLAGIQGSFGGMQNSLNGISNQLQTVINQQSRIIDKLDKDSEDSVPPQQNPNNIGGTTPEERSMFTILTLILFAAVLATAGFGIYRLVKRYRNRHPSQKIHESHEYKEMKKSADNVSKSLKEEKRKESKDKTQWPSSTEIKWD